MIDASWSSKLPVLLPNQQGDLVAKYNFGINFPHRWHQKRRPRTRVFISMNRRLFRITHTNKFPGRDFQQLRESRPSSSSFRSSAQHTIINETAERFRGKILCCELGCSGGCITCRKTRRRSEHNAKIARCENMPAACAAESFMYVSLLSFCLHCIWSGGCIRKRPTLAPI